MKKYLLLFVSLLASTWLSAEENVEKNVQQILNKINANLSYEIWNYKGTNVVSKYIVKSNSNKNWQYRTSQPSVNKDGSIEITITFKLLKDSCNSACVAATFNFDNWTTQNYVMVPASVYNGNRFNVIKGGYMPPYPASMFYNKNAPLSFSDNPCLALNTGEKSKIEMLTGNAATPAMTIFFPNKKMGFIVLTEQKSSYGNNGFVIEENDTRTKAVFSITAPGVRKLNPDFGGFRPSGDMAANFKQGDEVALRFKFFVFKADNIPTLLQKFFVERKSLISKNQPHNIVPMSAVFNFIKYQTDKNRWVDEDFGKLYFEENSKTNFQIGWTGGMMNTFAMLACDDPLHLQRVKNTLDFVVDKMQGKSGYFYGAIDKGVELKTDKQMTAEVLFRHNNAKNTLVRKNADVLLWFIKHFELLKALGKENEIASKWVKAAQNLAQAFVNTWEKNHDIGQYIDPETGEVIVYNTTGGGLVPAGLAWAARYFNNMEYLHAAKEIAQSYYNNYVVGLGLTNGSCADISQDADSESAFGFVESLMALYAVTTEQQWLDMAKNEVALASTWVISYDYKFPEGSDLDELDAHVAGAVWASTQNKHAAPGICCASGDYLFKLYRATGDVRYAQLMNDIQHAHTEVVEIPGRSTVSRRQSDEVKGTAIGSSMERIQISDAEGKGAIGNLIYTSNGWTESNGMFMAIELPGIYLQTDGDAFFVFDHVMAKIINKTKDGIRLSIKNPTKFDGIISIFAETKKQSQKPLPLVAFTKWQRVNIKAGQEREFLVSKTKW